MSEACSFQLATAVPPRRFHQTQAAGLARSLLRADDLVSSAIGDFFPKAGVDFRSSVLLLQDHRDDPGSELRQDFYLPATECNLHGPTTEARLRAFFTHAPGLAHEAAAKALALSGTPVRSCTHLITVSCTGTGAPGVEFTLIESLGLRPDIARTNIGFMGCHGAINGLRVAQAFAADPDVRVLLVCVELCTLHFPYARDVGTIVTNALFADGAAAAVIQRAPVGRMRLVRTGSSVLPDSARDMTWTVGDHGFVMTLSKRVPELIQSHLRAWLEGWLAESELELGQIRGWAVHPGGPKILDAVTHALELPETALAASHEVLREHGNMSSPTVMFILARLEAASPTLRGPVVALAFGPGLVVEAALVQFA